MIKGILALFTSGLILNPMVLSGIIGGFYMMGTLSSEEIHSLFAHPQFYAGLLLLAIGYASIFKRIYFVGGQRVDWRATAFSIIGHFLTLLLSIILSCLFVFVITLDGDEEIAPQTTAEIHNTVQKIQSGHIR